MDHERKRTVLIVDDESLIRFALASLFRSPEIELFSAETGIAALDTIRNHRLDLCLLDLHLPDLNGLDIMKALRAISPSTRVIIVSGTLITDGMMQAIRENAHGIITKPFDLEEVGAIAGQMLAPGRIADRADVVNSGKDSCVLWVADDARKQPRRTEDRAIACYAIVPPAAKGPIPVPARVLNSSGSGMCLLTPVELRPGSIVRSGDGSIQGSAVVRWCLRSGPDGDFRIGIQLIAQNYIDYLMDAAGNRRTGDERGGIVA